MLKKICLLSLAGLALMFVAGWRKTMSQDENILPDNHCVSCHSKISTPLRLSNKYYQWHLSVHRDNSVGCEKCHGGDPTTENAKKAHQGVLTPNDPQSRVNPANLPETCSSCHGTIVTSFVESKHYQKLKLTTMGPSCSTCHAHMASQVVRNPTEMAALCARCHDTVNGFLPPRPDIPEKAQAVIEALNRANSVVVWAERLIEVGQQKKIDLGREAGELEQVNRLLFEAKVSWHALSFKSIRAKAEEAFEQGVAVKDRIMQKVYPKPTQ